MQKIQWLSAAAACALLMGGCSNSSSSSNTTLPLYYPITPTDSGTAFSVSGSLPSNTLPSRVSSGTLERTTAASATATSCDYVYAVNTSPQFGSEWRKVAAIDSNGEFSLEITKGEPWILAFINTNETGSNMIKAIFSADTLDSIVPSSDATADSVDMTLETNSTNAYVASGSVSAFTDALGLSGDEATTLGAMDDLMLRYINPDIDGDGNLDLNTTGMPEIGITFWHEYTYTLTATSLIDTYITSGTALPTNGTVSFNGANPQLLIEEQASGFYSAVPAKWSLQWTNKGGFTGGEYADMKLESNATDGTQNMFNTGTDTNRLSLKMGFGSTVTDVPDGTYTYRLYANGGDTTPTKTFTFTHVKTFDDANNTENYVFPFPIFNVDDSGDVESVSYTWKRMKANGEFEDANASILELFVGNNEAEIKWYTNDGTTDASATYINVSPSENNFTTFGTVVLDDGVSGASFSKARTDITTVAISFVSKLGLWVKLTIDD